MSQNDPNFDPAFCSFTVFVELLRSVSILLVAVFRFLPTQRFSKKKQPLTFAAVASKQKFGSELLILIVTKPRLSQFAKHPLFAVLAVTLGAKEYSA